MFLKKIYEEKLEKQVPPLSPVFTKLGKNNRLHINRC